MALLCLLVSWPTFWPRFFPDRERLLVGLAALPIHGRWWSVTGSTTGTFVDTMPSHQCVVDCVDGSSALPSLPMVELGGNYLSLNDSFFVSFPT